MKKYKEGSMYALRVITVIYVQLLWGAAMAWYVVGPLSLYNILLAEVFVPFLFLPLFIAVWKGWLDGDNHT